MAFPSRLRPAVGQIDTYPSRLLCFEPRGPDSYMEGGSLVQISRHASCSLFPPIVRTFLSRCTIARNTITHCCVFLARFWPTPLIDLSTASGGRAGLLLAWLQCIRLRPRRAIGVVRTVRSLRLRRLVQCHQRLRLLSGTHPYAYAGCQRRSGYCCAVELLVVDMPPSRIGVFNSLVKGLPRASAAHDLDVQINYGLEGTISALDMLPSAQGIDHAPLSRT